MDILSPQDLACGHFFTFLMSDYHWCDIIDVRVGCRILHTNTLKKISQEYLISYRLYRNWVTPKESKDNRWLPNKNVQAEKSSKKVTFTTPENMGLNDNIKTRSLRVINFIHKNKIYCTELS